MTNEWYIATTKHNCEVSAKNSLDVYCAVPMVETVRAGRNGMNKVVLQPKYRGYVYVQHDGTSDFFDRVMMNKYITSFLSLKPVSKSEMGAVLSEQASRLIQEGDDVRITDGQYASLKGKVIGREDPTKKEFTVEILILGMPIIEKIDRNYLIREI